MVSDIAQFLDAKGGVGVLSAVSDGDKTNTEIQQAVNVTTSTLSSRLTEAENIGLIEGSNTERYDRRTVAYSLTSLGRYVTLQLADENAITNYWKMVAYEELVDDGVEQVKETLDENMESMEMMPDRMDPDPVYSLPDVDRNQIQSKVKDSAQTDENESGDRKQENTDGNPYVSSGSNTLSSEQDSSEDSTSKTSLSDWNGENKE